MSRPCRRTPAPHTTARLLGLGLLLTALLASCAGNPAPTQAPDDARTVDVTLCFGAASDAATGGRCSDASLTVELPTD